VSKSLRKGSRVSITFTGTVAHSDTGSVSFRADNGGVSMPVSWSPRLDPEIEVLAGDPQVGDVGVFTLPDGRKTVVMFRCPSSNDIPGWYDGLGRWRACPGEAGVRPALLADGTSVEEVEEEPSGTVEAVYVPQDGDVAFYRDKEGVKHTGVHVCWSGSAQNNSWYGHRGTSLAEIHLLPSFELVIRGSELQEGGV
jgi:hypothetical protein